MRIAVLIGARFAGSLDLGNDRVVFRYDPDYQRRGDVPLSVLFPLSADRGGG